jgi:hypothetical protein
LLIVVFVARVEISIINHFFKRHCWNTC